MRLGGSTGRETLEKGEGEGEETRSVVEEAFEVRFEGTFEGVLFVFGGDEE